MKNPDEFLVQFILTFLQTQLPEDKPQEVYSPMVYFCATMWHETENEMTQLLKSIFRLEQRHFVNKL